jgi:hypothetical protein
MPQISAVALSIALWLVLENLAGINKTNIAVFVRKIPFYARWPLYILMFFALLFFGGYTNVLIL